MRISLNIEFLIGRDTEPDRETDVYTTAELREPSDIPTAMRPIGFIPDTWEDKR